MASSLSVSFAEYRSVNEFGIVKFFIFVVYGGRGRVCFFLNFPRLLRSCISQRFGMIAMMCCFTHFAVWYVLLVDYAKLVFLISASFFFLELDYLETMQVGYFALCRRYKL